MKLLMDALKAQNLYSSKGSKRLPDNFENTLSLNSLDWVMHRGKDLFLVKGNNTFYKMNKEQFDYYKEKGYISSQNELSCSFDIFLHLLNTECIQNSIDVYIDKIHLSSVYGVTFEVNVKIYDRDLVLYMDDLKGLSAYWVDNKIRFKSVAGAIGMVNHILTQKKEEQRVERVLVDLDELQNIYKNIRVVDEGIDNITFKVYSRSVDFTVEVKPFEDIVSVKIQYGLNSMDVVRYMCREFDLAEFDSKLEEAVSYKREEEVLFAGFLRKY